MKSACLSVRKRTAQKLWDQQRQTDTSPTRCGSWTSSPGTGSLTAPSTYLHCPLLVSQFTSGEATPDWEQLQTSQPTTGWQPNVSGSHWVHSGCRVLGGQMQSPVTGSHNLVPQLQAGGGGESVRGLVSTMCCRETLLQDQLYYVCDTNRPSLTSAVGESPVARGAHGAVSTNHMRPTVALTAKRFTGVALGSDFMAGTGQRSVVEEGRQRNG